MADATESTSRQAAPKPRKWRRRLLKFAAAFALFTALVVAYLHTPHAFSMIVLPLVNSRIDGRLTVERGRVSLLGKLSIEGAEFANPDRTLVAGARSILAEASIFSFIAGGLPRIRSVQIEDPFVTAAAASEDAADSGEPDESNPGVDREAGPLVPLAIERLTVTGFTLAWTDEELGEFSLTNGDLTLTDLDPDKEAKISLTADYSLNSKQMGTARSGSLAYEGTLSQARGGLDLQWKGESLTTLAESAQGSPEAAPPLELALNTEGSLSAEGSLTSKLALAASQSGRSVGRLTGDVRWSTAQGDSAPAERSLKLDLVSLGPEVLNAVLAVVSPARFESGTWNGSAAITASADGWEIESTIGGRGLSLRASPEEAPTPPVDLTSIQKARLSEDGSELTITQAESRVLRSGRPILSAILDEAVTLKLNSEQETPAEQPTAADRASFTVRVAELDADELRRWLALVNSTALDSVEQGVIEGEVKLEIADSGEKIEVVGRITASRLLIALGDEDDSLGPFTVEQEISAVIASLSRVELAPSHLRLSMGDRLLLETELSGSLDLEEQRTDLAFSVTADSLAAALEELGLTQPGQALELEGGRLSAGARLQRTGENEGWRITGDLNVENASFSAPRSEAVLTRSLEARYELTTDRDVSEVQFSEVVVSLLAPGGAAAGTIRAQGHWPLASEPEATAARRGGEARVTLRDFNFGPWIDLMGWIELDLGDVPIEADLTLGVDSTGERFSFEGEERIGPVRLASGDSAPQEVTLTLANRFERLGDEFRNIALELSAPREGRPPDRVTVEGSATLGDRPSIKLVSRIESLEAGLYTEPFGGGVEEEATSRGPVAAQTRPPSPTGSSAAETVGGGGLPVDLDVIVVIDRLDWRDIAIEQGTIKISGEEGDLEIVMQPTRVNGGTIQGSFNSSVQGPEPTIAWSLEGSEVDAGTFIGSLSPQLADQVAGKVAFSTAGAGQGVGEDLTKSLEGELLFDLAEGQLSTSEFLEFIAKATGIGVFSETMHFDSFHGQVTIGDGWAELTDVRVMSPAEQLIFSGRIGLDGVLDVRVVPRLGPSLSGLAPKNKYLAPLLTGADQFTTLPIAVTITGTFDDYRYGVQLEAPGIVKQAGSLVNDAIRSVTGETAPAVESITRGLSDAIGGLLGGLTGRKNKKKEDP